MHGNGINEEFASGWSLLSDQQLKAIMADGYGLLGRLERLNSERDETFLLKSDDNRRFILKVANPRERLDLLEFQTGAFLHLEKVEPQLPVSRLIRSREGSTTWQVQGEDGYRPARLFTYMVGDPLFKVASTAEQLRQLGTISAMLGRGLSSYETKPPQERILWDMAGFLELGKKLLHHVDSSRQDLIIGCLESFETHYVPVCHELAKQPIHNDFNPHNILVDTLDHSKITAVIDFGDMVFGTIASDVGVALSYFVSRVENISDLSIFVQAYSEVRRLSEQELSLLPVLIRTRLAMTILITEWRAALFPENKDYILRNHMNAVTALTAIDALPQSVFQLNASSF